MKAKPKKQKSRQHFDTNKYKDLGEGEQLEGTKELNKKKTLPLAKNFFHVAIEKICHNFCDDSE